MIEDNEIVKLARAYQQAREEGGDEEATIVQAIREVVMTMIENQPDDDQFGPDPIAGLIKSSLNARCTLELHITLAVGAGYALAAQDAMAAIEKAGDQAAERN